MHTVAVRVVVRPHEARGIDQRLFALGQLRNAVVRDARKRAGRMREDERWRLHADITDAKERRAAYAALRQKHGVGETATRELACAHWKATGWMSDLLDRRSANALGREVWQSVEAWLYGGAGRPRTDHPARREMAWGNDLNGGLTLSTDPRKQPVCHVNDLRVVWSTQAINRSAGRLGRKRLEPALDWSCLTSAQRAHVHEHLPTLRRVGLRRTVVRGQARYWALLCLDAPPYRSQDHQDRLAERPADGVLGLDMGPTEQAWVSDESAGTIRLGAGALASARKTAARERRAQRALDRSRRAANPDCYDQQGRTIRGKRPRRLSGRGQRLAAELQEARRRSAAQCRQATIAQAREAALLAPVVRVEDQSFSSWQQSGYGPRMRLTTPGAFLARLGRELELTGGRLEPLPLHSAFSQYCVCGHKHKKPRSQDWHCCEQPGCPLVGQRLHRHLFSAWLMRITSSPQSGGIAGLREGTLATLLRREPVVQEGLLAHCASRRGRGKHPEGGRSSSQSRRRASGGAAGRTAQEEQQPTPALPPREPTALHRGLTGADVPGNATLLAETAIKPPPR